MQTLLDKQVLPLPDKQARISGKAHRLASIVAARRGVSIKELLDGIILADSQISQEGARDAVEAALA
jgi:hypothetical protein